MCRAIKQPFFDTAQVAVPNISYHLKRIFTSGELEPGMVIKEILITAQSGVRGLSEEKVKYYNLNAILSLGYRVNSVQATAFRKWATSVLKQYMLKGGSESYKQKTIK